MTNSSLEFPGGRPASTYLGIWFLESLSCLNLLRDPPVQGSQEVSIPQPSKGPNSREADLPQPAQGFNLQEAVMSQPAWGSAP